MSVHTSWGLINAAALPIPVNNFAICPLRPRCSIAELTP